MLFLTLTYTLPVLVKLISVEGEHIFLVVNIDPLVGCQYNKVPGLLEQPPLFLYNADHFPVRQQDRHHHAARLNKRDIFYFTLKYSSPESTGLKLKLKL